MKWLVWFLHLITFYNYRLARSKVRRRENYEFLKSKISERHFAGFAGLVIDFDRKLDSVDFACFKQPMYAWVKNKDNKWCVFWDKARMAREIGVGAPLKDGECLIPDTLGRTKPQGSVETIEERSPLTQTLTEEKNAATDSMRAPEVSASL